MSVLADVVAYLCHGYPRKNELSKSRLTKMIYLTDWLSALDRDRQITGIQWVFNHYGPCVDDVMEVIWNDDRFHVRQTTNIYGNQKEIVTYVSPDTITLSADDRRILDKVIAATAPKSWDELIRLVYSTYPLLTQPRHVVLDLPVLAREYLRQMRVVEAKAASYVPAEQS